MKKKFFDFSITNAIIVLLAYFFLFVLIIYHLVTSSQPSIGLVITFVGIVLSFLAIIIYYGFFPVRLTESGISHFKKHITKDFVYWFIRPNHRYRYNEIVFRNKELSYEGLSKKEIMKNEICVQYNPKYGAFLERYYPSK